MALVDLAVNAARTVVLALSGGDSAPVAVRLGGGGQGLVNGGGSFASGVRAMQTNEIVASGIELLANSASEPPIIGYKRKVPKKAIRTARKAMMAKEMPERLINLSLVMNGLLEEVPDHPLVKVLNHPNPFMSRGQLWGTVVMDRKLAGNSYLLKARNKGMGNVQELWRLRPDRVSVIPGDGFIAGYEYKVGNDKVTYPARDIVHFKERNPLDDYYGMPPLMSIMGRIAIDEYMKSFLRGFFEKGGTGPGSILTVKGAMRAEDKEEIQDRYKRTFGGPSGYHEMLILDNTESSFTQMGLDRGLRDALPKELNDVTESRILMKLGIPGSILGALIGYESSSYANKRQDWQVLWDITMSPLMSDLDDVLNLSFLAEEEPEFTGVDEVTFDISHVRALQEDEDALQERHRKNFAAGVASFEETRQAMGKDPEPVGGHVLLPAGTQLTPIALALEPKEEWTPAADILLKVLQEVSAGALDPDAAKIVLRVSFPSMEEADIAQMVDAAAAFEPKSAPAPAIPSPSGPDDDEGQPAPSNVVGVSFGGGVGAAIRDGVQEAQRGRPRLVDDPAAREVWAKAETLRRSHPTATQEQIAALVGVSERTLRRYRAELG